MIQKTLNEVCPNWLIGSGIFSALNLCAVPWQYEGIAGELDLEYHGNISGDKLISPLVNKIMSGNTLTESELSNLANVIYTLNHVKWEKEYNTMFLEYNPIENYSMLEKMTNDETVMEYGKTHTRTDNTTSTRTDNTTSTRTDNTTSTRTDNTTSTRTDNTTHAKTGTETRSPNTTNTGSNSVYGFNSDSAVPVDGSTNTETGTDTITYNTSDSDTGTVTNSDTGTVTNKDTGTVTNKDTGTVTNRDTGTVTDQDNGTDTHTRNYQLTRTGNIGTLTSQQMLESERNLYMLWQFFYDVVFPDVDRVLTLKVYKGV